MKVVLEAMRSDPDYAWSWHCNVAMAFYDAGGDIYTANQGAARFMRMLADVEPAHELPAAPQQAEAVPKDHPLYVFATEVIHGAYRYTELPAKAKAAIAAQGERP